MDTFQERLQSVAVENDHLYHITHVDNFDGICANGLLSDAIIAARGGPDVSVGMSHIKRRRLHEITVPFHQAFVGENVPFYFAPRSVMLYLIHKKNSMLAYRGGQERVLHLEFNLAEVLRWAEQHAVDWAFSLGNAGTRACEFRGQIEDFHELDWAAINAKHWTACRDAKQAEFLVRETLPMALLRHVGVHNESLVASVERCLVDNDLSATVEVETDWYYR